MKERKGQKGHKYDYTLKDIFQRTDLRFFEMITGRNGPAEILNIELPAIKQRMIDLLIRYADNSLYHFELQTKNEKDFHFRMIEYAIEIKKRFGVCPEQYVIYIGIDKPNFIQEIDEKNCRFSYNVIDVKRDINCPELLRSDKVEDWIIAPLCAIEDKEKVIWEITRRISKLAPREQADAFLKVEILLGLRKDIKEVFFREVKMPIRLKENYFYQEALKEGMEKGIKKGIEKGMERKERDDVVNLYKETQWPAEKISKVLKIPIKKVKQYLKDAGVG